MFHGQRSESVQNNASYKSAERLCSGIAGKRKAESREAETALPVTITKPHDGSERHRNGRIR